MGFAADLKKAGAAALAQAHAIHERTATLAFGEVVDGGPLSGAPGQPVAAPIFERAGELKASWTMTRVNANLITISTDRKYAPIVEDNLKGIRYRTGGPHSTKLVVLASDRLVAAATQQVGA